MHSLASILRGWGSWSPKSWDRVVGGVGSPWNIL